VAKIFGGAMNDRQRILDLIEKAIDSYERMLQKIVIEKDKEFNSQPYEQAIHALNQLLDEKEENV
jgi:ATP-dependent protease HslVU (ClpYQ) peptidase subunit